MLTETRILQPFRKLAAGPARAQDTLLRAASSGPITTFPYSLVRRD
jgi:hypothetical protein